MNRKTKLFYSGGICIIFAVFALLISIEKDGKEGLFAFAAFSLFGVLSILCFYIGSTIQKHKTISGL